MVMTSAQVVEASVTITNNGSSVTLSLPGSKPLLYVVHSVDVPRAAINSSRRSWLVNANIYIEWLISSTFPCSRTSWSRGWSRGRVQGVCTPTRDDLWLSNATGILQKKFGLLVLVTLFLSGAHLKKILDPNSMLTGLQSIQLRN